MSMIGINLGVNSNIWLALAGGNVGPASSYVLDNNTISGLTVTFTENGSNIDVSVSGDAAYNGTYPVAKSTLDLGLPVNIVLPDPVESPADTWTSNDAGLWIYPSDDPAIITRHWLTGSTELTTGAGPVDYSSYTLEDGVYRETTTNGAGAVNADNTFYSAPVFTEIPVTFDGTNDYLKLSSNLTGVVDGRTAYAFITHEFANTASATEYLLHGFANYGAVLIKRSPDGTISVTIRNAVGTAYVTMSSTHAVGAEKANIFVSVDADGTSYLYLWTPTLGAWTFEDDDAAGGGTDFDWTPDKFTIGAQDNGNNKTAGNMSRVVMHFNPTALPDFSLTAVQEKFANGSTGALINPGISIADYGTPQLDFYGDADTVWNAGANQGSSGDTFTMTGAVVNA